MVVLLLLLQTQLPLPYLIHVIYCAVYVLHR